VAWLSPVGVGCVCVCVCVHEIRRGKDKKVPGKIEGDKWSIVTKAPFIRPADIVPWVYHRLGWTFISRKK
jgi:hypothetical protein